MTHCTDCLELQENDSLAICYQCDNERDDYDDLDEY
jgi:hypothetical protein